MKFWKGKVVPSAQVTAWRVLENKLATKANLEKRGITVVSSAAGWRRSLAPICSLSVDLCGFCGTIVVHGWERKVCFIMFHC